jgi:1-phosphatidylinositol-4-phosphate 5-kinase
MPSFLDDVFSEPVSLNASDSSVYDPPHPRSDERSLEHSGSTDVGGGHLPNGTSIETHRSGKYGNGIISSGSYILNTNGPNSNLGSLPNGISGSINARERIHSHDGAAIGFAPDGGRNSPAIMNPASRRSDTLSSSLDESVMPPAKAKGTDNVTSGSSDSSLPKQPLPPIQTRHRHSASVSSTGGAPVSPMATLEPTKTDPSRLTNPGSEILGSTNAGASAGPLSPRLQHRNTLQVPRASMNRTSRDFSWPTGAQSEDAITGGVSPNTVAARRGSVNLVRRATRSIHSDVYLDEIPQDGEVARWTETVRQKRASRRKRKEEEEDERVMVGTKVDQNHVNWVTAYNMLTGIRFTVSRTNAKMDRELIDQDFDARHKFSFDISGNELTPSAKYDFKFKDYAPLVFRHLRATFQLDPADYLISLTSKYILSELGSPGKSGSFFYFSRDYKYIIKTIHHAEHKLLRRILRDYYAHIQENPNTLISQFYGLHRVKIPYGRKIHFVVMNNLFPPHRDIHQTFDLKGSTIGRDFKEEDLEKNPRGTLKDLNWLRRNYHLEFGPSKREMFIEQMKKDVALLQKLKIMDYSLLVGIHDVGKGNEEKLRDKTLQVFQPSGEHPEEHQANNLLIRTPSKLETARKARELRQIIQREKPVPMDKSTFQMPEEDTEERKNFLFYSDDGGIRATHDDGSPGEEIYYLGIIDCLTHVSAIFSMKWIELTTS